MYESPIDIIYSEMQTKLEGEVFKAVQNVGINVNKDELIKALSYDRQQYEKGYADAKAEQQWIPVSSGKLPEKEKKRYWICTDTGYQCECRWTNANPVWTNLTTEWHWNIFDVPQYSHVVAWMPLPEAYKGGAEECH